MKLPCHSLAVRGGGRGEGDLGLIAPFDCDLQGLCERHATATSCASESSMPRRSFANQADFDQHSQQCCQIRHLCHRLFMDPAHSTELFSRSDEVDMISRWCFRPAVIGVLTTSSRCPSHYCCCCCHCVFFWRWGDVLRVDPFRVWAWAVRHPVHPSRGRWTGHSRS